MRLQTPGAAQATAIAFRERWPLATAVRAWDELTSPRAPEPGPSPRNPMLAAAAASEQLVWPMDSVAAARR